MNGLERAVQLLTDPDRESSIETVGDLWREVLALYKRERRASGLTLFQWIGQRAREMDGEGLRAGGGRATGPAVVTEDEGDDVPLGADRGVAAACGEGAGRETAAPPASPPPSPYVPAAVAAAAVSIGAVVVVVDSDQ